MNRLFVRSLVLVLALVLVVACGGRDTPSPTPETNVQPTEAVDAEPTEAPEPTEVAEPTEEPTAEPESGGISSLEDVQQGVVQIVAEGTFIDPEMGLQQDSAGAGSGFVINDEGLAVTNNHVVTGAALLQVYVGGEDEPRNARVLGVSECSDLALIDIEGDGYTYLDWSDEKPVVGMDVYAAGFPLGDPEFTLTRGIISKARASGDTDWASVNYVLEHDATINPGNSGGPLITADGKVMGINYAGNSSTSQYFAISHDEAIPLLEQLQEGDVTSIGINGVAVYVDSSTTGIWVSSVKSGSPADKAGIEAGDIITKMEGLSLAMDGTMADYCDILRSHDADDVLSVEVLRFDTQEFLEGQINGDELVQSFSFAQALEEEVTTETNTDPGESTYDDYTTISDDSGQLSMEVPTEWSDVNGSSWSYNDETVGVALSAAPSLDDYLSSWTTPGVFFGASRTLVDSETVTSLLDTNDFSGSCEYGGREDYSDALYNGQYDLYTNCDGSDNVFINLAVTDEANSFLGLIQVQIGSDRDLEALDHILNSFIVGDVSGTGEGGTTPPVVEATPGEGDTTDVFDVEVGTCFNLDDTNAETVGDVGVVDCAEPHQYEVYHTVDYADGDFPGSSTLDDFSNAECETAFESFVGIAYADSIYYFSYFSPTEESWANGDREVACLITTGDDSLITGSLQGVAQ